MLNLDKNEVNLLKDILNFCEKEKPIFIKKIIEENRKLGLLISILKTEKILRSEILEILETKKNNFDFNYEKIKQIIYDFKFLKENPQNFFWDNENKILDLENKFQEESFEKFLLENNIKK